MVLCRIRGWSIVGFGEQVWTIICFSYGFVTQINAYLFLIDSLGTYISAILMKLSNFSFIEMHLCQMSTICPVFIILHNFNKND